MNPGLRKHGSWHCLPRQHRGRCGAVWDGGQSALLTLQWIAALWRSWQCNWKGRL